VIGALRQWLCTAARSGQTRDLYYACQAATRADIAWRGLDELLCTQQDLLRWALANGLDPEVRRFHRGLVETCALGEQAESVRTTTWFIRAKEDLRVIDGLLAERRPDLLAAPAR
jgi:hypothetical protein